jgi:beta-N-acetylhexosaminidase
MKRKNWRNAAMVLLLLTASCGMGTSSSPGTVSPSAPNAPQRPTPTAPSPAPALTPSADPASATPEPSSPADEIAALLNSMTLEQKVGQMLLAGVDGKQVDAAAKRMIKNDHPGGIILFKDNLAGGLRATVELINGLKQANAGNPAPLFLSVDQEGGRVSRLPKEFQPMLSAAAAGKTGNTKLAQQMGALIGRQLQLLGFNMNFAPVLDVNSNPKNPVIGDRSFGASPGSVARMGVAAMNGMSLVIPVVKHFPGHGDTAVDSHLDLPVVRKTAGQLEKFEWVPFKAAIEDKFQPAQAVMVAHILFPKIDPDVPASLSKVIIQDHLRGKLGFQGVVITDDLTMGAIAKNYGMADAAVRSVEAGSDILLVAHGYDTAHEIYEAVLESVKSGRIKESRIDESVYRILKLKQTRQLSDDPVPMPKLADFPNDAIKRWNASVQNGTSAGK